MSSRKMEYFVNEVRVSEQKFANIFNQSRKMEYFVNEVRVSEQKFAKIFNQLSMSGYDWEINRTPSASYIYTFG